MTRIDIEPISIRGERGQRYRVHHAGEVLIEETWNPEFDAARALQARGVAGRVAVYRDGRLASTLDIERAARLTIAENAETGPKVVKWVPFSPYGAVAGQDADCSGWVAPSAGISGRVGPEPAAKDGPW